MICPWARDTETLAGDMLVMNHGCCSLEHLSDLFRGGQSSHARYRLPALANKKTPDRILSVEQLAKVIP